MDSKNPEPNPDRRARAVALRYADGAGGGAPRVVAKGIGEMADQIVAVAGACGIPLREDRDLVALLGACDLGAEIPVDLYTAVAEILVHLYQLNNELRASA